MVTMTTLILWLEEFQRLWNKHFVILEDAAMSGVRIEDELGMWQTSSQVGRITAGYHSIVITVCDQDRLLNARQVGRFGKLPGMDSLEVSTERGDGNRCIALVRPFFQSLQEFPRCFFAIGCFGEEEIILRIFERQHRFDRVTDADRSHPVDAFASGRTRARENDLSHELRFFLRNHLRDEAAHGKSKQIDLIEAKPPDKGDRVARHRLYRVRCRAL